MRPRFLVCMCVCVCVCMCMYAAMGILDSVSNSLARAPARARARARSLARSLSLSQVGNGQAGHRPRSQPLPRPGCAFLRASRYVSTSRSLFLLNMSLLLLNRSFLTRGAFLSRLLSRTHRRYCLGPRTSALAGGGRTVGSPERDGKAGGGGRKGHS